MEIRKNNDFSTDGDLLGSVLTVGHFDVIHQGHVRLSRVARDFSDKKGVKRGIVLIDELFADASGFRPRETRVHDCLKHLADFVVIATANEFRSIFEITRPSLILQGLSKFQTINNFLSQNNDLIESFDCEVRFCSTSKSSSNFQTETNFFSSLKRFKECCISLEINFKNLITSLDSLRERRCFLLGDTLIDEYLFCDFSSMSGEAPLPVFNVCRSEAFVGGASVVFKHLKALGCNMRFCTSILGADNLVSDLTPRGEEIVNTDHIPVMRKRRYISDDQKLFRVNFPLYDANLFGFSNRSKKISKPELLNNYRDFDPDFVIATDFGCGFFSSDLGTFLELIAKGKPDHTYIDAQITPSRNGFDAFMRCGILFPTEKEARETSRMLNESIDSVADYFLDRSSCKKIIITCGSEGVIGFDRSSRSETTTKVALPALNDKAIDLTGAGDAFLCGFAISDIQGNSFSESLVMGSIFAGIHTSTIGNSALQRSEIDNYIDHLVNA